MYDLCNIFNIFLPQLLAYPNSSDPLNGDAASLQIQDQKLYEQRIHQYVTKYASPTAAAAALARDMGKADLDSDAAASAAGVAGVAADAFAQTPAADSAAKDGAFGSATSVLDLAAVADCSSSDAISATHIAKGDKSSSSSYLTGKKRALDVTAHSKAEKVGDDTMSELSDQSDLSDLSDMDSGTFQMDDL